jgi:divalent metal cation (Fe/Co/Zn/Cd) transporter
MTTVFVTPSDTLRRIRQVQLLTIAWMSIEATVSLRSAWSAHSPALAAFAGDSVIELMSALLILWRFRRPASHLDERRAARVAAVLLLILAAFVSVVALLSLLGFAEPRPSLLGIFILAAAALIMPALTGEKRRLSTITGSAALRADAAESAVCAYLSLIALSGLVLHAAWKIPWADPLAALAIVPIILYEARESLRGRACGCC